MASKGTQGIKALAEAEEAEASLVAAEKSPLLLPEVAATTEEDIAKLIADTNRNFPLTRANGIRALRGPAGSVAEVAGEGGEGADVVFRLRTQSGVQVLRREVKCIEGGAQGTFNREISHAAEQIGYNGEVLVQMPEGTDGLRSVLRFRGARTAEELGIYRSVQMTIVDPSGGVLWEGPLVP